MHKRKESHFLCYYSLNRAEQLKQQSMPLENNTRHTSSNQVKTSAIFVKKSQGGDISILKKPVSIQFKLPACLIQHSPVIN
jgi:hypothetical protein